MAKQSRKGPRVGHEASRTRFFNRDLSWLDFNRRVLALAEDDSLPLLERVKFLAIFNSNLDEFFQVRVALLHAELESPVDVLSPDGMPLEELLGEIRSRVEQMVRVEQTVFGSELQPALAAKGICIRSWDELEKAQRKHLRDVFDERIFPVLTPLAVDPAHPFPYVSDLSFNLAVLVADPEAGARRFARIKVPPLIDRFLRLPDRETFVPIEQVIGAHLDRLFPGMEIADHCPFRVTRDADLDLEEDDAENLLKAMESSIRRRQRLSDAVRVEVDASMSPEARDLLLDELELDVEDVYVRDTLIDLSALWELYRLDRPELKDPPFRPATPRLLAPVEDVAPDLFAILRRGDLLVQHPYDDFATSVEAFFAQAAADPDVLAIKHTIYRSSGPENNPIGRHVIRAAEAGKQVVTLVELKARFDEETNIEWARKLEQSGVHVVYGLVGLKTHGKVILVVRREGDQIRRYCHVGTGNYNPETARLYEDVGLFSADEDLGADLSELFNHITGFSRPDAYRKLLVAPEGLRASLLDMIREEMAHADGRILIKANSLSDTGVIDALYEASQAGVEIDLIVRGICCVRPGVPGISERIRARSVLGRFLEHSRIYRFGSKKRGYRYFIGSADLMPRNLDRRVEVLVPVEDPSLQKRLDEILKLMLADDTRAWELDDTRWQRVRERKGIRAQEELIGRAQERSRSE